MDSIGETRRARSDGPTAIVADDHATTRAIIRISLEEQGITVVGEASNGHDAVNLALQHRPDLCLLDVHMPGGSGLAAVSEITALVPEAACIVLTVSEDPGDLITALSEGALGFLPKATSLEDIGEAALSVLGGRAAVPETMMTHLVAELRRRHTRQLGQRVVDVTDDEWAMLQELRSRSSVRSGRRRWATRH